jgi:hypothetical protein
MTGSRLRIGECLNIQFPDKSGSTLRYDRLSLSGLGVASLRQLSPTYDEAQNAKT